MQQPTHSALLKAALGYARRGIPVFPLHHLDAEGACSCRAGAGCDRAGKHPRWAEGHLEHGHLDATTDPRKIHMWWSRWRTANVGVPTGKRSGFLVIDMDPAKGGGASMELLENERGIPATLSAYSGRGGIHLYYRYPAEAEVRNSADELAPGIDVRGEGGYIIAPPSATTGAYRWAERREIADPPPWMVEMLRERPEESPAPATERRGSRLSSSTGAGKGLALEDSGPIPSGRRNVTLFKIACSMRARGAEADELRDQLHEVNEARCQPPKPSAEVEKIAGQAARYPMGEKHTATAKVAPAEVQHMLQRMEARIWAADAEGEFKRSKSRRDVLIALLQLARKHGTLIPAGVRVEVSVRALAVRAAVATSTVQTAVTVLRQAGYVSRDYEGKQPHEAGAFVLLLPRNPDGGGDSSHRAESVHPPTGDHGGGYTHGLGMGVPMLRAPSGQPPFQTFTAPRLRRSSPGSPKPEPYIENATTREERRENVERAVRNTRRRRGGTLAYTDDQGREHRRVMESQRREQTPAQKRLGKSCGAVVDALEAHGPLTVEGIAEVLGYARPRDLLRRARVAVGERADVRTREVLPAVVSGRDGHLTALLDTSVVVSERTGGLYRLSETWRDALNAERERTGEVELGRRYVARARTARTLYLARRMAWRRVPVERIASKLKLTEEAVREMLRPVDVAPTREDMAREREARREEARRELSEGQYRALLRRVDSPEKVGTVRGPGRVWQVFSDRIGLVLDSEPNRVTFLPPSEITGEAVA